MCALSASALCITFSCSKFTVQNKQICNEITEQFFFPSFFALVLYSVVFSLSLFLFIVRKSHGNEMELVFNIFNNFFILVIGHWSLSISKSIDEKKSILNSFVSYLSTRTSTVEYLLHTFFRIALIPLPAKNKTTSNF